MAAYYDPTESREISCGVRNTRLGFVLSIGAGNVAGLLGVGGGAFKVPIMNVLMGVPLKVATATSNLMIGVTAAASAVVYLVRGGIDPYIAGPTAVDGVARFDGQDWVPLGSATAGGSGVLALLPTGGAGVVVGGYFASIGGGRDAKRSVWIFRKGKESWHPHF